MKRLLLSILMVVIGLSAFSQSPSRLISLRPAYPLAIGECTVGNVVLTNNGMNMGDVLLDSLPTYEIGQIFEQSVRYTEYGYGFFVKADTLKSLNVTYSYEVNNPPQGAIEFNEATGRFKYYPTADEYQSFTVTFTATNGTESVSEEVVFYPMPITPSEEEAINTQGTMPDAGDYTIVAETSKTMYLNNQERTAYSVSISGKDVIFDDAMKNKVWGLNGREDIYEMNIYAERLIVRSALSFPGATITVYAKDFIFEDKGNVYASINTTPSSNMTLTDGEAANGEDGGDITLYVKEFKSSMGIRLIANGAKGQSANRNGTPGKGGNGGTITSTIDISNFCDFVRGSGGVKYDVAGDGSTEAGPIIDYAAIGSSGRFVLESNSLGYLHPYYVSAVLRHADDAFINNFTDVTLQTCREYRTAIDEYLAVLGNEGVNEGVIDDLDDIFGSRRMSPDTDPDDLISDGTEIQLGLQNNLTEINKMLFKLEQGLDYFGNPVGWVPLLSFEVTLANYENEIDRAIPTLYMHYWLNHVDKTLQNMVQASQLAANTTEQEIEDNEELLNSLILEIPVLQDEADDIADQIDVLTTKIKRLQNLLMAQAIKKVKKKNRWKKLFGIAEAVVSVIPAVGPIATAVNVASNVVYAANTISSSLFGHNNDIISSTSSVLDAVGTGTIDWSGMVSDVQTAISGVSIKNIGSDKDLLKNTYENIEKTISPLTSKITELSNLLSQSSAPNSEVQQEYNKLLANSALYKDFVNQAEELNRKKEELANHLNQVFSDMTTTVSDISNNILALDAFRRDAFTGNSKRDLNAMIYLEKMEQRAKSRLLLYDYYLRKAYEYRLLKPYEGEFNLVGMFERFENQGQALGDVIDEAAYNSLKSVFKDRISDMTEQIINEYAKNNPEQSAPITIAIPKEQIEALNANEDVTLNFHEMGIFSPDEENVRIVGLNILSMDSHIEGNVGYSGYMDLNMTHSGVSVFRKDGHLYWFDHRSRNAVSPHTWGIRYDAVSNRTTNIQPSAASNSLLSSVVGVGDDAMLFSRPSAWSDITFSKKVHTSGGADVVIDNLVIELQYDFTRRPNSIRNIDITANDGLLPYIACSEEDVSGRSGGNGNLYRSYRTSSRSVTFTAVDKYESFWFKNWTDRAGTVVSDRPELTVKRQNDQFYIANYEFRGPELSVPDTIRVGKDGGAYTVNVRNVGSDAEEMDWYVSDEESTWVHLDGEKEGVDDGSFTFEFEPNTTGKERVDFIEILAPETYTTAKTICIVQLDEDIEYTDVSELADAIYVSPIHATAGKEVELPVKLKNTMAVNGCSFTLTLPSGFSLKTDEDDDVVYELGSRVKKMSLTQDVHNSSYDFALTPSSSTASISGSDGTIVTFYLQVPDRAAAGDYQVTLTRNAVKQKVNGVTQETPLSDIISKLTVGSLVMRGDVNNSGDVTPADAIMILYKYFGVTQTGFNEAVADVNGDGSISPADAIEALYIYFGASGNSRAIRPAQEDVREPE